MADNPCMRCGACCAHFRVSFYWRETTPDGTVPAEMTQKLDAHRCVMRGTDQVNPRCTALSGIIGESVACTIYEGRPSPCREFGLDWLPNGLYFVQEDLDRCTAARAAWGMPPIYEDPTTTPFMGDTRIDLAG